MIRASELSKSNRTPLVLNPTDRVTLVPVLNTDAQEFDRDRFFESLADRIENATPPGQRPNLITVGGVSTSPGPYPMVPGLDVVQILSLAELDGEHRRY